MNNLQNIEEIKQKVLFVDALSTSKTSILVGELAKVIRNNGVDISQNELFTWLRENDYLINDIGKSFNMPTQKSISLGLFEVKKRIRIKSDESVVIIKTPKVTVKGQQYFVNKFLGGMN